MFYYEIEFYRDFGNMKFSYDYRGVEMEYGIGLAWDKDKSPIFLIEKVDLVCVDQGSYWEPPHYEPEGIESIIVRPRLKYPKR